MKKTGPLNRDVASVLSRMGHTDTIIVADCGLPIPDDTPCIDLSLKLGTPSFSAVLAMITEHVDIEDLTLAEEIKTSNLSLHRKLCADYQDVPINYIAHEDLKRSVKNAKAVIRTGEATPFANAIVQSGVIF